MVRLKRVRVAMACAALVSGIGDTTAVVATAGSAHASGSEVLAFGDQRNLGLHAQFGIFSTGADDLATGIFSFWQKGFPTSTSGWRKVTASISCALFSGNDAVLTGTVTVGTTTETVVAEVVDNTSPSRAPSPDGLRFSFDPTITEVSPGCFTPGLGPIPIKEGDIRVAL
jgi:hypothetical protein